MIGVVVPVKDERDRLAACLASLSRAARHPGLGEEAVLIVVVLDDCSDGSAEVAAQFAVTCLPVQHSNVGAARAEGARIVFAAGARWLASTDADSVVADDWLVAQLAEGADLVCGTIAVDDWSGHPPEIVRDFETTYQDRDDHRHIHGANLGLSRSLYEQSGGFLPLTAHEDVSLVRRAEACGAVVAWTARPRVVTSARLHGRTPEGFAATLRDVTARLMLSE